MERWIELADIEKSFEGLCDLLLREQILNVASPELRVFLKERKPANVSDMAEIAEHYLEVHNKLYDRWSYDRERRKDGRPDSKRRGKNRGSGASSRESDKGKEERREAGSLGHASFVTERDTMQMSVGKGIQQHIVLCRPHGRLRQCTWWPLPQRMVIIMWLQKMAGRSLCSSKGRLT